jgi:hypothetical protein
VVNRLAPADSLLILRKPFDPLEVRQMVHALCAKWILRREVLGKIQRLEHDLHHESAERLRIEAELDAMQRIGLIGQLASGVASEAGLPVEQREEAMRFLRVAFEDMAGLIRLYRRLIIDRSTLHGDREVIGQLETIDEAIDLASVEKRVPEAFRLIIDGQMAIDSLVHAVRALAAGRPSEPEDPPRNGRPTWKGTLPPGT